MTLSTEPHWRAEGRHGLNCGNRRPVDLEFSLALHDKTGKYFIGREILASNVDLIDRQIFWRTSGRSVPHGLTAKVIGRLLAIEVDYRTRSSAFDRTVPRLGGSRPIIHMDPLTVVLHRLSGRDVVLCHDIGPLTHPELFHPTVVDSYRMAYAEIAATGPFMVFVSVASQRAFHALFSGAFAGSRVIYPALREEVRGGGEARPSAAPDQYLLTVGSLGLRKNQRRAIEAFAGSGLFERGYGYVLCGSREVGAEAVADAAARTPGVVVLDYVTDEALNWLYRNAAGFVLPSLLEGFGMPVAEAVCRGLIPLVSGDGVLQEVAGAGALFVDPLDTASIAEGMRALVALSPAEASHRRDALKQSLARFSPEIFASQWREVIMNAAAAR